MPDPSPYISKSRFLWGRQCRKLLWHAYHGRHLFPPVSEAQQAVFDQGHEIGQLAKTLFPGGIEVAEGILDLEETLTLTRQALCKRMPLFEAAFAHGGAYCRVDILEPVGRDAWNILEVKGSTQVKEVHLWDVAFQTWVLAQSGVKVRACKIMHLNRDYIRQGSLRPRALFHLQDVTAQASRLSRDIEQEHSSQFDTLRLAASPEVGIGTHCHEPYDCPLIGHCWAFLPENSVMTLYRDNRRGFDLLERGILRIKDIPEDYRLTKAQEVQRRVASTQQPHADLPAIRRFLQRLEYPVSYLDFETINPGIPLFDGTRPYQQVPFQFSLHIVEAPGRAPRHHSFLAEGTSDPRREFLERLVARLPRAGSVIVYNATFEKQRLRECVERHREHAPWLERVEQRMLDLLVPFRRFHYHHIVQEGSAGMKAVLPALTGRGYEDLAIQDGGAASRQFLRAHFTEMPPREKARIRKNLEAYCRLDTEGMIWMVEALERLAEGKPTR